MQACKHSGCRGYVGKLDIEKAEPPSIRSFLHFVQDVMNTALALENANASGGVEHPPFHFDYLEVSDGTKNAHAFRYEGFSFIVVTLPLVQLLWDLSQYLSASDAVQQVLGVDRNTVRRDALHALLFQFQIAFLVSHEYTHHVHRHCDTSADTIAGAWTEFTQNVTTGGLDHQAQELVADGFAIYLTLANFLRGGGREGALEQLEQQSLPSVEADEILLKCFFVALASLFCALWPEDIPITEIRQFRHPPAPVRIEYAIRVAIMWCNQYGSVPESWFGAERFRQVFSVASGVVTGTARKQWDTHIAFLRSEDGAKYDKLLLERFEIARKGKSEASRPRTNASGAT